MKTRSRVPWPLARPVVALARFRGFTRFAQFLSALALLATLSGSPLGNWTPDAVAAGRAPAETSRVVAVTTDFTSGSLSIVSTEPSHSVDFDISLICADAVARVHDGTIYVINRFGCGSVQVIDPNEGTIREFTVGVTSNPQDIAFVSDTRAYVTRYASNWLFEVEPATGAIRDSVDLGLFADDDGFVEMHALQYASPYLYVSLQRVDRLDGFEPNSQSYLAIVDPRTNTLIEDPIVLDGRNPVGPMELVVRGGMDHLVVATVGSFRDPNDGGLELVNLETRRSAGRFATGQQLGGDLLHYAVFGETTFAIVSDVSFVTTLVAFDSVSGTRVEIARGRRFDFNDCLITAAGELWLADQYFEAPGIRIFDPTSGQETTAGPISTGLPPFALVELRNEGPTGPIPGTSRPKAFPNPAIDVVQLRLPHGVAGRVHVFDVRGRRVRTLDPANSWPDPESTSGETLLVWDGEDDDGRPSPSGAYWLKVRTTSGRVHHIPVRIHR